MVVLRVFLFQRCKILPVIPFVRPMASVLLFLFLYSSLAAAHPFDQHPYRAQIDVAKWEADGNPFECKLWQVIPHFGEAVFKARAGEDLRFYLMSQRRFTHTGQGKIETLSPDWRYDESPEFLGNISVEKGNKPVTLTALLASRFITALQHGQFPRFILPGWHQNEKISIEVSSVNFGRGYKEYLDCLSELLPANFQQMEKSLVLFDTDQAVIKPAFEERLEWVWKYLNADPLILIKISGHTDDVGKNLYNWHLSKRRALAVKDYLIEKGVASERIVVDFFGEMKPTATNRNHKGRYKNRRTLIRMERVKSKDDFTRIQTEIEESQKVEVPSEVEEYLKSNLTKPDQSQ